MKDGRIVDRSRERVIGDDSNGFIYLSKQT